MFASRAEWDIAWSLGGISFDHRDRPTRFERQRDTKPELRIRRRLHGQSYRYRIDVRPEPPIPRRADMVFARAEVAVFIDGCFRHACPEHMSWPKGNSRWWAAEIGETKRREPGTTARPREAGWTVVRIWEHKQADEAASRVAEHVDRGVLPVHRATECDGPARNAKRELEVVSEQAFRGFRPV